jgi:hypothetical protein
MTMLTAALVAHKRFQFAPVLVAIATAGTEGCLIAILVTASLPCHDDSRATFLITKGQESKGMMTVKIVMPAWTSRCSHTKMLTGRTMNGDNTFQLVIPGCSKVSM